MARPASDRVTLVEVLERTASFDDFTSAARAAVRRLETEGVSGLASIRFYATPRSTEVGAVITFSDPDQVMEHIRLISSWPEFRTFIGTVKPLDVRVYGRLGEDALAWLRTMNVVSARFEDFVTGFVR